MRTTLDIEKPILADLRRLAKKRHRTMGKVASDLLAEAMKKEEQASEKPVFYWNSKKMHARVDLADRDAIYDAMDRSSEVKK